MNSLDSGRIATLLQQLHRDAEAADKEFISGLMANMDASGKTLEQAVAELMDRERDNYREVYRGHQSHYLAVSPTYGRFLYAIARACKATRIVEFGSSMGVSTIYLATALRDNGGGQLIGSELEPGKVKRARAHVEAAGLAELVDIREGDALETLRDVGGAVDMLLLDGSFALYLPVLKLLEPQLRPGAVVLGENAFDRGYLDYVRHPAHGYIAQTLPLDEGRGNEFAVRTI